MSRPVLLLTGASGMVGRNILEHPLAENWDVYTPTSADLDLTELSKVQEYLLHCKPDLVVHAAGLVGGIQANIADPLGFLDQNMVIGRNIVMGSYRAGVRKLVNLGSTCMYPRNATNPLEEEMILTGELEPTNEGYALAKIIIMRLCQYISRQDQRVDYKTLVPCNLFGRHDNFEPKNSHLLPAIIHKIHCAKKNGEKVVEIWGDGTARREFMYAGDLADAVLVVAQNISSAPDLMNCGLGYDHSVTDYYEAVKSVLDWDGEFVFDVSQPVGMQQKLCSTERMRQWGWTASTSLDVAIKSTYEFYLAGAAQ